MKSIFKLSIIPIILSTYCINASNTEEFPLHVAAKNNNTAKLKELLKNTQAKVDAEDGMGNTALYTAIQEEKYEAAECLLKYGACVDHANQELSTPIQRAALAGNYKITELLLSYNADPNKQNKLGNTALHIASKQNLNSTQTVETQLNVIKLLLQYGADKTIQNNDKPRVTAAGIAEDTRIKEFLNSDSTPTKKPQFKKVYILTLRPKIQETLKLKQPQDLHPGSRILYFTIGACVGMIIGITLSVGCWYTYKKLFSPKLATTAPYITQTISSFTAGQPLIAALQQAP